MNPLSIGLFVDSFTPIMDGVTVTVHNYAYWLGRIIGPTYVVTPRVPGYTDEDYLRVIRFLSLPTVVHPPYRIGLPGLDLKLKRILKSQRFSLVHAHSPFSAGHTALKFAREMHIPVVATFHSKFRENLQQAIPVQKFVHDQLKRIVDFLYAVDQVWIPQQSVAVTLRDYGYHGSYQVVENGTDFTPPSDITSYRAQGAKHLGISDEIRVGLFVGQMVLEKNLEFLLNSISHVITKIPHFQVVLVGEGYAKHRLQRLSQELGIRERISFHNVIFDREILKAIYARADLFLLPSLYDNAPLVLREAAAMGTPAVLLRGATAAEVIRDNENGFLTENSREAFAARVVEAIMDPARLKTVGAEAQRTLCRSWENVAQEVRERYLAILSGWRK